ncbi:MAG: hypothetical protein ACJA2A_002024 [Cycloclasticus pugetii]|jgi:hypothetical protein
MNENEHIKYQLETLAAYSPDDLGNSEIDVLYETESGYESFITVSCVDLAERSLNRIKELELQLGLAERNLVHTSTLLNSCETALADRDGLSV